MLRLPCIVMLVVLWRLRYKLSLCDLVEMFVTVRDWEAHSASLLTEPLRATRRAQAGKSWYADETYVKVYSQWHYLYRAS